MAGFPQLAAVAAERPLVHSEGSPRRAPLAARLAIPAVLCAALAAFLSFEAVSDHSKRVAVDAGYVIASGAATVLCLRAARRAPDAVSRRPWLLLGVASLAWFTGNLVWGWYEVVRANRPFPSVSDGLFIAALPFAAAAIVAFRWMPENVAGRARVVLDAVLCASSILFIAWELLVRDLWNTGGSDLPARLVAMAYPLGDVVLVSLALGLVAHSRVPKPAALLVAGSAVMYAVADANLAHSTLRGTYETGQPLDALWVAAYAGFAVAATIPGPPARERDASRHGMFEALVPYALSIAAILVAAANDVRPSADPVWFALGAAVLAVAVVRQVLVVRENVLLTDRLEHAVSERTEELAHLAFHDPLTGLSNRALLQDRLVHALARQGRAGGWVGVLLLDVDDFKTTNDALGHAAGDALLAALADRLGATVRHEDTLARFGGDEFAVVVERLGDSGSAVELAQRLLDVCHAPLPVDGHDIPISVSIGVAIGHPGDDAEELLRHADVAMHRSKASGKNRFTVFADGMHAEVLERLRIKTELRGAVHRGELVPYYQPIVDLRTGRIERVEALVRWLHPTRGLVPPGAFVSLAEETGAIVEIGAHVLRQAAADVARWRATVPALEGVRLSVNLSARQLSDDSLVDDVRAAMADSGLDPEALTLEITESMLMADPMLAVDRLAALRSLGVRIALDDFGTGYSSLSHLQRFPVDDLKVDKSFIDGLAVAGDEETFVWVEAIISLGHTLGLAVTAEGIERPQQLAALRELRCDHGQGYLFSRPVPAEELVDVVERAVAGEVGAR